MRPFTFIAFAAALAGANVALGAEPSPTAAPDFSAYAKKYPWSVPRVLIEKPMPGAVPETNFDEAKVPRYTLPDIFTFASGEKIRSAADWPRRRRELVELFRREVFGVAPSKPDSLTFRLVHRDDRALAGQAIFKRVAIAFQLGGETFQFHLTLFVPQRPRGHAPGFLLINHRAATPDDPGSAGRTEFWPADYGVSRGYAMGIIDAAAEIDPDKANSTTGVRAFYRQQLHGAPELTWGTLAAWAWASSRALDYSETDREVDATRVAIVGHSRGGKTALWAGAADTRFRITIPNDAGQGGPALARRRFGNTIEVMTRRNPHWLVPGYASYAQREATLTFDQHMEIALIAPRYYHEGDGSEDLWHDPRGSWLALTEASRVWALLGAAKPMSDPMPLVNELTINGTIAYHMRTGGHGLFYYDWKRYFDHADAIYAAQAPNH